MTEIVRKRYEIMNVQQKHLLDGMQELFLNNELTDIILVAEETEIHCHRNVLAASSAYFRAMFHDYKERNEGRVELHDITFHALDLAITFMYTDHVDITHDNVQCLLTASSILQLDTLLQYCVDHMTKALCTENCVDVYNLADYQSLIKLKESAQIFILDHFVSLIESRDLMKLDRLAVKNILLSDDLNVDSEETVFNFLVEWVENDLENRKRCFKGLFQAIRILLMSDEFISDIVETSTYVKENPFSRAIVSMSKLCRIGMNNQETEEDKLKIVEEFELNNIPRLGMYRKRMLVFSGGGLSDDQRAFACYDTTCGKCYTAGNNDLEFKNNIDFYQLVTNSENQIYFLGGIFHEGLFFDEDGLALDSVFRYDPRDKEWRTCQPMNTPRCAFAACAYDKKLLVFGGALSYPNGLPLESVEMYDPVFNTWYQREPLPFGLTHHAATVYKESVLIIGGEDDAEILFPGILQYNIVRDTWSTLDTRLNQPRLECVAITHDNMVYVLGGGTKSQNMTLVEVFDPETLDWRIGGEFPDDRKFKAAVLFDGSIYVCGGVRRLTSRQKGQPRSRSIELKDLYRYDLEKEIWSKESNMIQHGNHYAVTTAIINTRGFDVKEM